MFKKFSQNQLVKEIRPEKKKTTNRAQIFFESRKQ